MNTPSSRPTFCSGVGCGNGRYQAPKSLSQLVLCCSSGTQMSKDLECRWVLRHVKSIRAEANNRSLNCKRAQYSSTYILPSVQIQNYTQEEQEPNRNNEDAGLFGNLIACVAKLQKQHREHGSVDAKWRKVKFLAGRVERARQLLHFI